MCCGCESERSGGAPISFFPIVHKVPTGLDLRAFLSYICGQSLLEVRLMLEGFKKFILRGNVVDMAVGVVIGAAFAGVVGGLTSAFLNPLIKLASGGGEKVSTLPFTIHNVAFPL